MLRFASAALVVLSLVLPASAGPYPVSGMPAGSPAFVGWATGVSSLTRGPQSIASPAGPFVTAGSAANALGAADGTFGTVSLGDGGQITVTFSKPITNGSGADFAVFENGFAFDPAWGLGTGNFAELAFVEVSSDGVNFVRFPSVSLTQTSTQVGGFDPLDPSNIHNLAGQFNAMEGTPFDLQVLAGNPLLNIFRVTHVRLVDVVGSIDPAYLRLDSTGSPINERWDTDFDNGGFDLDAVGVIHEAPAPAGLALSFIGGMVLAGWRLRRRALVAIGLLALLVPAGLRAEDEKKELAKLQGTWIVVAAEKDGQPLDRINGGTITIKDSNFVIKTANGTEMKGDLRIDPAKKPKHMDLAHQEGLLRDKTWQAIYEVTGDEFKLCYTEADTNKARPTEFTALQDSGRLLVVMKRK